MLSTSRTDLLSVAKYVVSAVGAILLLYIFLTLLSALDTLWSV